MLSTSDFELEQNIYERENGDEWERIRGFVQQRVDAIRAVAEEAHEKTKSEMTNSRWEDHQDVFDEYKRPNSKPKLPLEWNKTKENLSVVRLCRNYYTKHILNVFLLKCNIGRSWLQKVP